MLTNKIFIIFFFISVFSIAGYSRLCRPAIILFRPAFIFQSWSIKASLRKGTDTIDAEGGRIKKMYYYANKELYIIIIIIINNGAKELCLPTGIHFSKLVRKLTLFSQLAY
jgi:hypothetical protein